MKTHLLENVCQGYHPLRRYVNEAGDVFKSLDIGLVVIKNDLLLGVVDYSIRRLINQSQQHSNLFAIWSYAPKKYYGKPLARWTL